MKLQANMWNGTHLRMQLQENMWNGTPLHVGLLNITSLTDNEEYSLWNVSAEERQGDVFQLLYFRVLLILAYSFVFLCCFTGNLMVMVVVMVHRRMRTATNLFLANLALSDFCVGIFCVYQNLMMYLTSSWALGDFLCRMYHFIQGLSYTASVLFLTIISLERYVVIVHPMWGKRFITLRRLRLTLIILWLISAIYNSPRFILYGTIKTLSWLEGVEFFTLCVNQRSVYNSAYFDLYNFAFLFVFPLMVMGILYTKIAIKLWHSQRLHRVRRRSSSRSERHSNTIASMTTDQRLKKASVKEVPVQCLSPLPEEASTTLHEEDYLPSEKTGDFESSTAEDQELEDKEEDNDDEEGEELLEHSRTGSRKSYFSFSRKGTEKRHSCSRSDSIQQEQKRESFKSIVFRSVRKDVTSNIKGNELEPLPSVPTDESDHLAIVVSIENESPLKDDFNKFGINSHKSDKCDDVSVNCENETSNTVEGSQTEAHYTFGEAPDPIIDPIIDHTRKFKSFLSEIHRVPNLTLARRSSEPPTYVAVKSTGRRASEPFSDAKSLLQISRSDESRGIKESRTARRIKRKGSKVLQSRRKIIRLLIAILCSFAICNLPYHARKFWQTWSPSYNGGSNMSFLMTISTTLVLYMNSGVNPFLYAFLSVNFRKCIKDVFWLRTHIWRSNVYSPQRSNNSKSTGTSSSTSASRGSASSSVPKV